MDECKISIDDVFYLLKSGRKNNFNQNKPATKNFSIDFTSKIYIDRFKNKSSKISLDSSNRRYQSTGK